MKYTPEQPFGDLLEAATKLHIKLADERAAHREARGKGRKEAVEARLAAMQPQLDFILTAVELLLDEAPKQIPALIEACWFDGRPPGKENLKKLRESTRPFDLGAGQRRALEALRSSMRPESAARLRARRDIRSKLAEIFAVQD